MYSIILTIHIILAVALTILVLLQRSEGGALGALGGGSGSNLLTGRQAGNFLSRATAYLFVAFICTSLSLVILAKNMTGTEKVSILPTESVTQEAEQ